MCPAFETAETGKCPFSCLFFRGLRTNLQKGRRLPQWLQDTVIISSKRNGLGDTLGAHSWLLALGRNSSCCVGRRDEPPFARYSPRTIALACGLGAASSSCSYAAVALARSMFRKGANFTAAMAF